MASVTQTVTRSKAKRSAVTCPTIDDLMRRPNVVAAAYGRLSLFRNTVEGFGMVAQDKDYRAFCTQAGWALPEDLIFQDGVDEDASGADWDLKGLNKMLDAAKAGRFHVLVVTKVDRFARNMTKAMVIEQQLREMGIPAVYMNLPLGEQGTATGNMLKNTMMSFAEYEREAISFRTARGRREKAAAGLYVGTGPVPYGYRRTYGTLPGRADSQRIRCIGLEIEDAEARVVRLIYDRARFHSMVEIVRALQKEGIDPPRHDHWHPSTVRRILRNATYKGLAPYGTIAIAVPAIVSAQLWDEVQKVIPERLCKRGAGQYQRGTMQPAEDVFELRRLLKCGQCGGALTTMNAPADPKTGYRTPYYRCPACRPSRLAFRAIMERCTLELIPARALHALVWAMVKRTLLDPDGLSAGLAREREKYETFTARRAEQLLIVERDLTQAKRRLDRIVDEMSDPDLESSSETYLALKERRGRVQKDLDRLRAEQRSLEAVPVVGISATEEADLERAGAEVRAGLQDLEHAAPAERQAWYRRLGLVGTIANDDAGISLGRHRYRIEFRGKIGALSTCDSEHHFQISYGSKARAARIAVETSL